MIKAIIGLGNPGASYEYTRHNIGFRVVDALAEQFHGSWRSKENAEVAEIMINDQPIILVKPQTFMNSSGKVLAFLQKKGIKPEELLLVHDELELPFGQVKYKMGGSAKGHNGLKSIIAVIGEQFGRIRCGIGRPTDRNQVPDYVLTRFSEPSQEVDAMIHQAVTLIEANLT